jgi:hypothetical protein
MNKDLKKLILRLIFLTILLIVINLIYEVFFFEKDIQKHSDVVNLVRKVVKDKAEVIYLGESSNFSYRGDDKDTSSISEYLSEYYPNKKFGHINKAASHAEVFYELLNEIPEKSTIKTVIVTLNVRTFNADCIYSDLETYIQKSLVLLKDGPPIYRRFLLSFKGYDIKTNKEREKQKRKTWRIEILKFPFPHPYKNVREWDGFLFHSDMRNKDGTKNQFLIDLSCSYVKSYAFQIDTLTNPRIKDFDKIVDLAKKRNWKLVFNLMAENVEKAEEIIGPSLTFLMYQNRDLLISRYTKKGVLVVDNFNTIPDECFIDTNWTSEHYSEFGRRKIALNLANHLTFLKEKPVKH